ncbi:nucleotide-binding universal stress UspA family protein [Bacillus pakistanensis]|uniref:Nucleotide-binding universal stress UspA family protein n=1 Tax=Rossellomorea pakistanensis TaxID=992288 RepID=A0ABS2NEU4_9BACI|nr:universal stress protein [Bacillus pakistanensis]MBM7586381.1 nucleotide-binding universal stress UspA family protein [Bacillus pakistanensis]
MYKNILLAYDQTEPSKKALNKAEELLKAIPGAKLTIVHVASDQNVHKNTSRFERFADHTAVSSPGLDSTYVANLPPNYDNYKETNEHLVISNKEHEVLKGVREDFEARGLQAQFEILSGSESDSIIHYAEEHNVDLILLGNSGKSGIKKWFLGSVSEKITHECPCSVLIVK